MRTSLIAVIVFALDRWSKYLVETHIQPWHSRSVVPGLLDIVHSRNHGVAFGLFDGAATPARAVVMIAFSLGALIVLGCLLWRNRLADAYSDFGIGLIIGGAAGNIFDRIYAGAVTDFLDFYRGSYHWYTFNLADAAISVGAGLLLIGMLRRGEKRGALTT